MDADPDRPADQPDPWQAALDRLDQLRSRLEAVGTPERDDVARRLMREVELDRTTGFIVLLDRAGTILDVNPGALITGGLERRDVVGALLWEAPWWHDSPRAQEETARAVRGVVHEGAHARFDADVWIEAEGTARGTLDLSLRPLRGRDGMVAFVLADGRNVTDRTRAERRITRQHAEVTVLNDRLALLVDHHRRIVSNLSHDLRMPIQVILTRAERILEESDDAIVRAETRAIRLSADRALAQMESMLQQARSGETEDRLHPSEGDLAATVRFAAEEFTPLAERRSVTLDVDVPEHLRAAYDPERVSRIVANLIANAVRFSPEGGVIGCSLRVHGSLAHLEVSDSGPGIAAEERKRMFERFAAGGDERSQTGLGLSIVHENVTLHGGTVSVDSSPDGGALFVITLPLDTSTPSQAVTLSQQVAAARQAKLVRLELEDTLALPPVPSDPPAVLYVGTRDDAFARIDAALGDEAVLSRVADGQGALEQAVALQPPMVVLDHEVAPGFVAELTAETAVAPYVVALAEPGTARWRNLHLAGAHAVLTLPDLERKAAALLEHEKRHRAMGAADPDRAPSQS
jgi:PAS domain S-box-containing protein